MSFDAGTAAAWVQAVGSVGAILVAVWTVDRAGSLARKQMDEARERDVQQAKEEKDRRLDEEVALVEVAMALAISCVVRLQSEIPNLQNPESRLRTAQAVGLSLWLDDFDHLIRSAEAFPFHRISSATPAVALVQIVRHLRIFRGHAVIVLEAALAGYDRSDVLEHEQLGLGMVEGELDLLTTYRDHLKAARSKSLSDPAQPSSAP